VITYRKRCKIETVTTDQEVIYGLLNSVISNDL